MYGFTIAGARNETRLPSRLGAVTGSTGLAVISRVRDAVRVLLCGEARVGVEPGGVRSERSRELVEPEEDADVMDDFVRWLDCD